jgi:hypothetical protein
VFVFEGQSRSAPLGKLQAAGSDVIGRLLRLPKRARGGKDDEYFHGLKITVKERKQSVTVFLMVYLHSLVSWPN